MSTSIDDLFKFASSTSGTKRKADPAKNPEEIYKAAKLAANATSRKATAEEEVEENDGIAGPELPPDEQEEVDDEEGRFFGGGVSKDTADILDFIDEQDGDEAAAPEKMDSAWLRKMALNFERHISKNAELRAKFEDDPQKFMASEADLDTDVKALSILTDHPSLYAEFAKLGCVNSLVSLLAHENTDISIAAIEILSELTDEDVQAPQDQWDALVSALLDADLPSLLVENLSRLDETLDTDRSGNYHTLSLIENLASQPTLTDRFTLSTPLLPWLLTRIQAKETPTLSQNTQYAAELLSILLQSSSQTLLHLLTLPDTNAIDIFLQLLAPYRKRTSDPPRASNAEEYAENLFDALICCLAHAPAKRAFVDAEGIELCLIMLREGRFSKPRALRLLDHALSGPTVPEVGVRLVEAAGLKTVFGLLMKEALVSHREGTEHVLGILASLLRLLPGESAARIRLLAKFVEKEYEKVGQVFRIRARSAARLGPVDLEIAAERERFNASAVKEEEEAEAVEAEWQSRRLDAGLYSYQTCSVILAWLIAEDTGARMMIVKRLGKGEETVEDVTRVLEELRDGATRDTQDEQAVAAADMYATLVELVGG